jgi:hypothetical protein
VSETVTKLLVALMFGKTLVRGGEVFESSGVCQVYSSSLTEDWEDGILLKSQDTGKTHAVPIAELYRFSVSR